MNSYQKKKFTSLYTKFQQALTLQGYSKTTYDNYSRGIRRLAAWCDRCPDQRTTNKSSTSVWGGCLCHPSPKAGKEVGHETASAD